MQTQRVQSAGRRHRISVVSAAVAALISGAAAFAAPFTPGDIVVTRYIGGTTGANEGAVGAPGSGPLLGSGQSCVVALDEYNSSGTLVQELFMPYNSSLLTGNNKVFSGSGTQNTEGHITLSADGTHFVVAGYNFPAYVTGTNIASAAATTVNRVVGMINMDGAIDTTTGLTDVSSGQAFRSATANGTDLWMNGTNGTTGNAAAAGIHYAVQGATTSTQVQATSNGNHRQLKIFSGQLYLSNNSATATIRGINTVGTGLPTATGAALGQLPGFSDTTSPTPSNETADGFWFKDANTLYIADDRNGATGSGVGDAANGGVQKWTFDDTNADTVPDKWVMHYNVPMGLSTVTGNVGAHGLSGFTDLGGNAVLFATTFDGGGANSNRVVMLTDTGTQAGMAASFTIVATSATNSAFRGVEVVPANAPEPASIVSVLGIAGMALLRRRGRGQEAR
jgi:hypothetical protein